MLSLKKNNRDYLGSLPDWVVDVPQSNASGIFGMGSGIADDPAIAIRKAKLVAEFALAEQIRQEVSGQERGYNKVSSDGTSDQRYELLIDKLVSAIKLKCYSIQETHIEPRGALYNAYVLAFAPASAIDESLKENRDLIIKDSSEAAFDKMLNRIEKSRNHVKDNSASQLPRHEGRGL